MASHARRHEPESDFDQAALSNLEISELLALEAENASQPLLKALRRASRKALFWPEEADTLIREGRSLTELPGVGPYLEKGISQWLRNPPPVPKPPPLRSNFFSWTQAQAVLAKNPSYVRRLRGDLQMHTRWSDGEGSVKDMAEAAADRGYELIAITDHSKGLKIAGGINEAELEKQTREIEAVNLWLNRQGHKLQVLRSIELNISPQGEGDMEPDSLAKLDLVVGCFHSKLRRTEDQTDRYLAALRNPDIQILGHPRGRIYNFRLGLTADWPRVFDFAAELDKAVEIDSYPDRQDLSLDLLGLAKKSGCRISLSTDAHGPSQLRFIDYGLAAAASAGIKPERILNFMTCDELLSWAAEVREAAA
jgi:histidinol phosphatase-like PHP family hydrolase